MCSISDMIVKIGHWLDSGTGSEILVRKVLVTAAAILIVYRVGYTVGKLLFHIGS